MKATSLPRPPIDEVVAVAADQHVVAVAAGDRVVAGAAVDRQSNHAGGQAGRVHRVVAAERVDDERSLAPSEPLTATSAGRPATVKPDPRR